MTKKKGKSKGKSESNSKGKSESNSNSKSKGESYGKGEIRGCSHCGGKVRLPSTPLRVEMTVVGGVH